LKPNYLIFLKKLFTALLSPLAFINAVSAYDTLSTSEPAHSCIFTKVIKYI